MDTHSAGEHSAQAGAMAMAGIVRRQQAMTALAEAIAAAHPADASALMAAALDDLSAGMPEAVHPFSLLRSDARFWAECAHEAELEAYLAAALRQAEARAFALAARKRLLVALFQSLPDADRRQFLARVDPRGLFQGREA